MHNVFQTNTERNSLPYSKNGVFGVLWRISGKPRAHVKGSGAVSGDVKSFRLEMRQSKPFLAPVARNRMGFVKLPPEVLHDHCEIAAAELRPL